jgi:hypothetical protein
MQMVINLLKNKLNKITRKRYLFIVWVSPLLLSVFPLRFILNNKTICIWKNLFDIDCIGCGITRSILLVFHFEFSKAYECNSFVFIVFPVISIIWTQFVLKCVDKN